MPINSTLQSFPTDRPFTRHHEATADSLRLQFLFLATAALAAPSKFHADNLLLKITLLAAIAYWFSYAVIRAKRDASPTPLDRHLLRYGFLDFALLAALMLVSAARAASRL